MLENVAADAAGRLDLTDGSATQNTRSCYPLDYVANHEPSGRGGQPRNVVMLTADAFGVLPPIAKLSPGQAMYHFLSGYTARVAGTEKGLGGEPQATFSTCFGAPFLPRRPEVYGAMASRPDPPPRIGVLAGQHRLVGRRVRRRAAHADPAHAGFAARRARWQPGAGGIPSRPRCSA